MTVRPARPDEHAAVGDLRVAAYRAAGVLHEAYEPSLRRIAGEVLVAAGEDGGLLGTVVFVDGPGPLHEVATPDEAEFRMLAVDPAAQGAGVGAALVRACAERARALGRRTLVASSRPQMRAAHRLYERLGFVRDPARDWVPVPGVDLVVFVRDL